MTSVAKILIPKKEWIITDHEEKIGSISKNKKGYVFLHKGLQVRFNNLVDIKHQFGISVFEESINRTKKDADVTHYNVYGFPCKNKPYDPLYSVRDRLPIFCKKPDSKSKYCAGYYLIKNKNKWVKTFCPKLILLQRYPYFGPYKNEGELNSIQIDDENL
jgi:hypothetical protein